MARNPIEPLDIDHRADVLELVAEVRAGTRPRLLRNENRAVAMIVPLHEDAKTRGEPEDSPAPIDWPEITDEVQEAFRATAGGWKDFDADAFNAQNRASRDRGSRPPVDL